MSTGVRIAFERRIEVLPLSRLLPLKAVSADLKQTANYRQIARSVSEVGIIEPLVIPRSAHAAANGQYLLLDGHLRHAVLPAADRLRALRSWRGLPDHPRVARYAPPSSGPLMVGLRGD
jgi:hypothetical protein